MGKPRLRNCEEPIWDQCISCFVDHLPPDIPATQLSSDLSPNDHFLSQILSAHMTSVKKIKSVTVIFPPPICHEVTGPDVMILVFWLLSFKPAFRSPQWWISPSVTDFTFLGSKIIVDSDCSLEYKRCLLLGRKAMTNPDSILKSRDITLLTKIHIIKARVFPVVMYRCESWTIKKVECWRIKAFKLWCWRRLLRVPWTAARSSQSILKEINPKYLLEGLMLKLKLQYFGYLMQRADSLEKTLMLGNWGEEKGATEDEMVAWHHWLNGHEFEQTLEDS